jgi:hypothetical protein
MRPSGTTLIDHPEAGGAGLRRAARILGEGQIPQEVAALLLPMVRRAVRTERGPSALVSWLRQRFGPPPAGHPTERAATLADDLARLLAEAPGSPADTLDDGP